LAGISEGVLVVEAALQLGSLITADLAPAMGKDVWCRIRINSLDAVEGL